MGAGTEVCWVSLRGTEFHWPARGSDSRSTSPRPKRVQSTVISAGGGACDGASRANPMTVVQGDPLAFNILLRPGPTSAILAATGSLEGGEYEQRLFHSA